MVRSDNPALLSNTFFLGEAVLTDDEEALLRATAAKNQSEAEKLNRALAKLHGTWSLYARPMFNFKENVLTHANRDAREIDVLEFIRNFDWSQADTWTAAPRARITPPLA